MEALSQRDAVVGTGAGDRLEVVVSGALDRAVRVVAVSLLRRSTHASHQLIPLYESKELSIKSKQLVICGIFLLI